MNERLDSAYQASDGAAYERLLGRRTRHLADRLINFVRLPAEGPVLDVGCGTGSLAISLHAARPLGEVVGVDAALPFIEFARRRNDAQGIRFEVGDVGNLPFADRSFVGSVAQLVLNFVPDADAALGEMRRVTRPGGVLAAAVWDFRGGVVYQRLFWDTAAGLDPAAGERRGRLFSNPLTAPDGLAALWHRTGLVEIDADWLTIRMEFADFADYWTPFTGGQGPVGAYVEGLAPDLKERLRASVQDAFLSGAPDGPRSLLASTWVVRGVVP